MRRFSKIPQLLVFLIILVLLCGGGYYYLLSQILEKNKNLAFKQQLGANSTEQSFELVALKNILRDTEFDRNELDSYILQEEEIVVFLETIESMQEHTGAEIDVRQISKEQIESTDLLEILELQIIVKGTWSSVYHFITLLEELPYQVQTQQVILNFMREDEWNGQFVFTVIKARK